MRVDSGCERRELEVCVGEGVVIIPGQLRQRREATASMVWRRGMPMVRETRVMVKGMEPIAVVLWVSVSVWIEAWGRREGAMMWMITSSHGALEMGTGSRAGGRAGESGSSRVIICIQELIFIPCARVLSHAGRLGAFGFALLRPLRVANLVALHEILA